MNDKHPKTLLIVDDEPDIREMLKELFEKEGYTILLASSGLGLLDTIERHIPDLIVLDLLLPGEHGLDLAATIKKRFFIPMILISGIYKQSEIQHQMDEIMAEAFLEKPIQVDALKTMAQTLLA